MPGRSLKLPKSTNERDKMKFKVVASLAAVAVVACSAASAAVVSLPALYIDKNEVTVSGLSGGGFGAVQLHVAYSATFKKGAAIIAGGPYNCAEGSQTKATGRCMKTATGNGSSIPTATLVNTTNTYASQGLIDPVSNLQGSKVYIYSGKADSVVAPGASEALETYYKSFVPAANIQYKKDLNSGHGVITDNFGGTCTANASPYINNCGYDQAGAIFAHLYGAMNPRNNGTLPEANYIEFNQNEFLTNHGFAATGWAYIPAACKAGGTVACRVHISMHGCIQSVSSVQQKYIRNTGFNRWADTNNIVVVYPQLGATATNQCSDWWGYDSANYAKKTGPQLKAMNDMVTRLASGGPAILPPTGVATSGATNSSLTITWNAVSGATGYNIYRNGTKVNASPVTGTSYTDSGLASGTNYNYVVKSIGGSGGESGVSNTASGATTGTPPAVPAAPTGVSTSGATASSLTVSWSAVSGATSYNVYRNGSIANPLALTSTTFTNTGLAASTTYSFTVTASNANGESAQSSPASGTTSAAAVCTSFTASNYAHVSAGRAYQSGGYAYANGSKVKMGLWNTFSTSTLKMTGPNYYVIGACP